MVLSQRPVVLDACVLINLLAGGRLAEMAAAIAPQCLICDAVRGESLFLHSAEAEGGREAVDLGPWFAEGTLVAVTLSGGEEKLFIRYARDLDDGEAMSMAVAESRGLPLATDDRKARAVAAREAVGVRLISTAEIVFAWAGGRGRRVVAEMVRLIRERARFLPPSDDPRLEWWLEHLRE